MKERYRSQNIPVIFWEYKIWGAFRWDLQNALGPSF